MTPLEILARAFAALASEQLAAFSLMGDHLRGLSVRCRVGPQVFRIRGGETPELLSADGPADASVAADKPAILALIDGESDLLAAVRARRLAVKATPAVLLRVARAQRAFAEGAARSRTIRALVQQWRNASD